jgi:integrase
VAKGQDPRVADPTNSDSFVDVVEAWHRLEQVGRLNNRSADLTKHLVLRLSKPLHHRPIGEISYRDIETLLAKLCATQPATAIRLHAHLKTLLRWCARTGRVDKSPIADMPPPAPAPRPRERDWFKRDAADPVIKKLWAFASELGGDQGKFLKLLLITGKRRGAILSMCWDDIDADWYWTPPAGSKHKRNTPIPLPKLAQRVLGQHRGTGPVLGRQLHENDMAELARKVQSQVEPTYFHHGLRHVVATKLAELKTPPHIARLILDHAAGPKDAHAGYEHVDWRPEMAEALEQWCAYIERLVAPAEGVAVLR